MQGMTERRNIIAVVITHIHFLARERSEKGGLPPTTVGVDGPNLFCLRRSSSSCSIECTERSSCEEERALLRVLGESERNF